MSLDKPLPGLGAVVLAGGQSRRMGRPKALLPFGHEVLLQRVVRRLGAVCSPIVVVRAPGQTLPDLPGDVRITEDQVSGKGPLQGIAAGLLGLSGAAEVAFVSSTDAPFVEPAFVRLLFGLRGAAYDVVVPRAQGHYHPLAAVYGVSVCSEIERLLAEDRLRPFFLFERVRTLVVDEDTLRAALAAVDPELFALRNLNTPADWQEALALAGLPPC
jgi:molybdenum cofactor guanylyltransferase